MAKNETTATEVVAVTKSDAFKKLAVKRTTNAVKAIELLGNLTVKGNYDSTDAQWAQIFGAIEKSLAEVKARQSGVVTAKGGFTLAE